MTVVTVGSGATIKSTTAEAQLLEIFDYVQLQQLDIGKNPENRKYITSTYTINTGIVNGTLNCPYTRLLSTDGSVIIQLSNYMTGITFNPGTGSTFKSVNPVAYALEVLMFLQIAESDINKNPNNENRINVSFDDNSLIASANFSMPFSHSLNSDGSTKLVAKPYLQ